MVKKDDKPIAVVTSPEADEDLREPEARVRERAWAAIERIGERNKDQDVDDVLRDVNEVVEEVRRERYERAQRTQRGR